MWYLCFFIWTSESSDKKHGGAGYCTNIFWRSIQSSLTKIHRVIHKRNKRSLTKVLMWYLCLLFAFPLCLLMNPFINSLLVARSSFSFPRSFRCEFCSYLNISSLVASQLYRSPLTIDKKKIILCQTFVKNSNATQHRAFLPPMEHEAPSPGRYSARLVFKISFSPVFWYDILLQLDQGAWRFLFYCQESIKL